MADKMHHMLFVAVLQAPWKLRPCQPSKPGYDPTSEFRQSDSVDYYRLGLDFLVTMAMHLRYRLSWLPVSVMVHLNIPVLCC